MDTKVIPKTEWSGFFDSFSRKHEGWMVSLEVFGEELGAQVEQQHRVLAGITEERRETAGDTIMIMVGGKADDHITHSITVPKQVSVEQTEEGTDAVLEIKSNDGTTTLLRCHSALPPEIIDALAG